MVESSGDDDVVSRSEQTVTADDALHLTLAALHQRANLLIGSRGCAIHSDEQVYQFVLGLLLISGNVTCKLIIV